MKVMITGAGGFVGNHLKAYLKEDFDLICTARNINKSDIEFLDLQDKDVVDEFINKHNDNEDRIDALVHTAYKLVDSQMTIDEQMRVFDDNIAITKSIIKIIKSLNINVVVNCSSMAVYPNEDGEFEECSEIRMSANTDCLYGLSKFVSENMLDFSIKNDARVVHFRISQIYGEGMRTDRIIPVMIDSIKNNHYVEVYGNGERVSNFVSVEKVCEAISIAISDDKVSGIYNVGGENITYMQLAQMLVDKYGDSDTHIIPVDKGSRAKFVLCTDKWDNYIRQNYGNEYS